MKPNDINPEDILTACEDLQYLNRFAGRLRETEYRILLILCGHTKYGKVTLDQVRPILNEYWQSLGKQSHLKNIPFVLNKAINKIKAQAFYLNFNTNG